MDHQAEIKYYGKKDTLPPQRTLNAGNLNVIYDEGNLRYISCNGKEIIRMIYAAVRDQAWLAAFPEIMNEIIEERSDSFNISYQCRFRLKDIDFKADFEITGSADGRITYEMQGEALTNFLKNRIGFCILHPAEGHAGEECSIVHSDGSEEVKSFPEYIDPGNPFLDIYSMSWKVSEVSDAVLTFYGDVFETEDQRNWTDASFKTYCTPLKIPYPVKIEKGTVIHQKIELIITGESIAKSSSDRLTHIQIIPDQAMPFPSLGLGRSSRDTILAKKDASCLKKQNFGHYRADLYFFSPDWEEVYKNASREAGWLGCPLELAIFFGDEPEKEAKRFFDLYSEVHSRVRSVFLFHEEIQSTRNELIEAITVHFRQNIPGIRIFAGTNCNFAQLNRSWPHISLVDGLVFAIHPQEHAFDNMTLVENLQAQSYAVESAQHIAGGKEIAVSPVTIQRRFNANIENFEKPSSGDEIPWQVDSRQMSLFGAGWTAMSFKYIAQSGVASVTYYETTGERGIMMGARSSRWPGQFIAKKNSFFPMFHVLAFISRYRDVEIIRSVSSNPLKADALCLKGQDRMGIILVNLNHTPQRVCIPDLRQQVRVISLDERSFDEAIGNSDWLNLAEWEQLTPSRKGLELTLKSYACVFISTVLS
jgi:hypothetical protein